MSLTWCPSVNLGWLIWCNVCKNCSLISEAHSWNIAESFAIHSFLSTAALIDNNFKQTMHHENQPYLAWAGLVGWWIGMVLSGSHANRKMIRTVWCSAKRKLSVLLVSLCKMVRPTGGLTKEKLSGLLTWQLDTVWCFGTLKNIKKRKHGYQKVS